MIQNDFIAIFIYKEPFQYKKTPLLVNRLKYLPTVNESEQRDSLLVWRLLEEATRKLFNKELNDLKPQRLESGKWVCDEFNFSLSHSGGVYVVAISNKNIGIDVQQEREPRNSLFERLSDKERNTIGERDVPGFFKIWTQKESLYKWLDNKKPFNNNTWKQFDTTEYPDMFRSSFFTIRKNFHSDAYFYLSICSELKDTRVQIYSNIENISEKFV